MNHLSRIWRIDAALVFFAAFLLWQFSSMAGLAGESTLASPAGTAAAIAELVVSAEFWSAFAATALSWALGLMISMVLGVALGTVLASSQFVYESSRLLIDFGRTIPPIAFVPVLTLGYGRGVEMKVVLIVIGAVWPIMIQTYYGVSGVSATTRMVARSFRLGSWLRFSTVTLPAAAPLIATGLRISAVMALLLSVGGELVTSAPGLGNEVLSAQINGLTDNLFAYIVIIGLFGYSINAVLESLERRTMAWQVSK